jgi:hypothetical protein
MSFIECAETPFDDMNEDPHAETSLKEEFVPATPSLIGGIVETVGDWIKEYISKEVIDNIYDDHSCWITIFNQYDLPSLRGLLAKIDMRMMLKMSGPQNWNTIKSFVYQDVYSHLHGIAYKECRLKEE